MAWNAYIIAWTFFDLGSITRILTVVQESLLSEVTSIADRCCANFRLHCNVREYCKNRCKLAMPFLLADDVLEPVCTMCAQIAARYSQERVNTWIRSHITPGVLPLPSIHWAITFLLQIMMLCNAATVMLLTNRYYIVTIYEIWLLTYETSFKR
jgi:hypothetical protein